MIELTSTVLVLPINTYPARIVSIHDGDTIHVDIALGFGLTFRADLRFLGIDTPELDTPEGRVSSAFVQAQLPIGALITVVCPGTEKYGRQLAEIRYKFGATNIQDILAN